MSLPTALQQPLPPPSVALVDPKTGLPTPNFAQFLAGLADIIQKMLAVVNQPTLQIINANYTTRLTDARSIIEHNSVAGHTYTIDSNANVAYDVGTIITFVNRRGSANLTISCNDTMVFSPGGSLTSRTLAANGVAIAIKVDTAEWLIYGFGLT